MTNEKMTPMPYRAADAAAVLAAAGAARSFCADTRTASARSRRASSPTSSGTACGTGSICATAGASRAATW